MARVDVDKACRREIPADLGIRPEVLIKQAANAQVLAVAGREGVEVTHNDGGLAGAGAAEDDLRLHEPEQARIGVEVGCVDGDPVAAGTGDGHSYEAVVHGGGNYGRCRRRPRRPAQKANVVAAGSGDEGAVHADGIAEGVAPGAAILEEPPAFAEGEQVGLRFVDLIGDQADPVLAGGVAAEEDVVGHHAQILSHGPLPERRVSLREYTTSDAPEGRAGDAAPHVVPPLVQDQGLEAIPRDSSREQGDEVLDSGGMKPGDGSSHLLFDLIWVRSMAEMANEGCGLGADPVLEDLP